MMKLFLTALLLLISVKSIAIDSVIYANGDGTYTYHGQIYTFEEFPIKKVVIVENKIQIFPDEMLSIEASLVSVKPLARKFIKAGYEVETKMYGQIIPYIVQKKGR
ncbi:MAG: hypothetical protein HND53_00190 [Proteobacteria bacterium]|nr:hypothetical protein [Pseudomonadota bacterium]NOG58893.1 hypothetical protein [Pseudomonadota bacterium]